MKPSKPAEKQRQNRHLPAAILLELADRPLHGGAIHTALSEYLPDFKPDTGAVYRTLQKLESEGEIEFTWDTASPGPARKVYSLTAHGWERLSVWKADIEKRRTFLDRFLTVYARLAASRRGGSTQPKKGR